VKIFSIHCMAAFISLGAGLATNAAAVCVNANDAADFQAQLTAAAASAAAATIKVPRGTYHLGGNQLGFDATAMNQGQFDIEGGYNSDCSRQIKNPALTIIDGDGMSRVLDLASTGGISVRYLTLQGGNANYYAGLYIDSGNGGIIVDYNIIRNNVAIAESGFYAIVSGTTASGNITVDGNLVYANSTTTNIDGGGFVQNSGLGTISITNNTIAGNSSFLTYGAGGLEVSPGSTQANISNNIFWGNTGGDDLVVLIGGGGGASLIQNDYSTLGDTPPPPANGNLNIDPNFSGSTDFHLLPTSPLLGAGTLTPAGGLPTIDIEGHPRSYNNLVDMGAYERGDEIFGDGFDD
jgi:hypothetical protein